MVRRSFRGREDQLHRGNCLQLGQDSLQGRGLSAGRSAGGRAAAAGNTRRPGTGRWRSPADGLRTVHRHGRHRSGRPLSGPARNPAWSGYPTECFAACGSSGPTAGKDFQMQRVRVFRHLCFYPDPGRAALSGRDPVVHGELEHAFCKGIRQSIRREESLEPRPLLCLRQGRGHLLEAGACGTVEQRAQRCRDAALASNVCPAVRSSRAEARQALACRRCRAANCRKCSAAARRPVTSSALPSRRYTFPASSNRLIHDT